MQHRERELQHFLLLDPERQREAIQRLAAAGLSPHSIATATALSVEQIRHMLAEHEQAAA